MKISMIYFGSLSVNRYKIHGTHRTRPEVVEWMDILASRVRKANSVEDLMPPITIEVYGYFKDNRYPDLDNLAKVIQDAVKVGLGIDDKYFRYVAKGSEIGHSEQSLDINISGGSS